MTQLEHQFSRLTPELRQGLDPQRLAALQSLVQHFEALSAAETRTVTAVVRSLGTERTGSTAIGAPSARVTTEVVVSDSTVLTGDIDQIRALDGTLSKEQSALERQVVSDESRSQQDAVRQATDAVTQQSNLATSILDELSTLLSSIYR